MSLTVVLLLVWAPLMLIFSGPALAQDNVLSVTRTQEEIVIDGLPDEVSWSDAILASIETSYLGDGTKLTVEMRALYDEQYIYFFVKWSDPSFSVTPDQWLFTGGEWDSTPHDEDRFSILWNTEDSIVGFDVQQQACWAACHNSEFETATADERGDLWQWLAGRTNPSTSDPDVGWMDDLTLEDTGVVPDDFTGSRVWEANSMFAHDGNASTVPFAAGDLPKWKEGNPPPNPDPEGLYLFRGYEEDLTDPLSLPDGTHLPGYLLSKPSSGKDRADIAAKGVYDDSKDLWTLELRRRLVTGHDGDVDFSNLLNPYSFGVAIFDNKGPGEDNHYCSDLVSLRFDVPELNLLEATPAVTSPVIGDKVNVTVHLKNMAGYSTHFDTALYIDNLTSEPIATRPYDEMDPSEEDEFNFSWDTTGLTPGEHKVIVKVDSEDIIPEHNENNNVVETVVEVFPPIKEFKASTKKPTEGDKVKLTAIIDNPSDEDANVTVIFWEGETVLDTQFANITARGQVEVTYKWKAKKPGKHLFKVELQGAINTLLELTVDVKEESPGPGPVIAALAIALAAGMAATWRRRWR